MKNIIIKNLNMILNIDKKILELFDKKDLKVYFYNSWCEWTKVNITPDFEKKYLESIIIEDKNILGHLMMVIPQIAYQEGIDQKGYRVIANTGDDGGQTVYHLHFHILKVRL